MTIDCLDSVSKSRHEGFLLDTIVVDNGSTDGSVLEIGKKYPKTVILKNQKNVGFAEGNNVGISYVLRGKADYVCLLNNDTRVDQNFLLELFKTADGNPQVGIVGGKIYFEKGYEFHKDRYKKDDLGKVIWYAGGSLDWDNVYAVHRGVDEVDRGQYDKLQETEYVNGCLMLIKREVFEKVGFLDPKYFLYFEENDFCQRAKKAGYKLLYVPRSVIWHLTAASSGSGSNLHDYFLTRNRLLFGMRWAPLRSKMNLIQESFKLLFSGRKWQKIGIKDFYLGRFGQGSWKND